jgi:hypothetical protein
VARIAVGEPLQLRPDATDTGGKATLVDEAADVALGQNGAW